MAQQKRSNSDIWWFEVNERIKRIEDNGEEIVHPHHDKKTIPLGSHLFVWRYGGVYSHHGIYCGGMVI